MKKNWFFLVILIIVFGVGIFLFAWRPKMPAGLYDDFAKCLAGKGLVMYGAQWCSHCQNEKKAFGDSFQYVPYIECPDEPQKCIDQKVEGFPTWIFADGRRFEGEMGLEKLSQESGCPLP